MSLLIPTRRNLLLYLLYSSLTACSAMFVFAAHSRSFLLLGALYLSFLLVLGAGLFQTKSSWIRGLLKNKALWILCIFIFTAFDESRYVQRLLPHPEKVSSGPALMEPARNLLHGRDPYAVRLPDGASISPGPGWILLLAPITLAGGAGLLTGLSTLLTAWLLAKRSPEGAGVFVLLVALQPVLVDNSIWGTDLFAIPIFFAALCLLTEMWSGKAARLALLGVVAGLFAQSRIPMLALLLILGLGLWRRNRSDAKIFMLPAITICTLLYASIYLWTVHDGVSFQPINVLHREGAHGLFPPLIGLLGVILVTGWILLRMQGSSEEWILAGGLLLAAAFVPTGLGELPMDWPHLERWEGANYASFAMSLIAAYLALKATRISSSRTGTAASSSSIR